MGDWRSLGTKDDPQEVGSSETSDDVTTKTSSGRSWGVTASYFMSEKVDRRSSESERRRVGGSVRTVVTTYRVPRDSRDHRVRKGLRSRKSGPESPTEKTLQKGRREETGEGGGVEGTEGDSVT